MKNTLTNSLIGFALAAALLAQPETVLAAVNPFQAFSARNYSSSAGVCTVRGDDIGCASQGDYVKYDGLDFGANGGNAIEIGLGVSAANAGQTIEIRLGSTSGQILGKLVTVSTGGKKTQVLQKTSLSLVKGVQSIVLRFVGRRDTGPIDTIRFIEAKAPAPLPTPVPTPISTPIPTPVPTPPATAGCPAGATPVAVGSNIAQIVGNAAEGASFCIQAGVHRMQAIIPKRSQKFYGQIGAVLNGSRLISSFSREGNFYVATGQTQQVSPRADIQEECLPANPRCFYPEAFFMDNKPFVHAGSLAALKSGQFFFDYAADKIYFLDNPVGHSVEASVSPYAFLGGASDVSIQGLVVEKYSVPLQFGAIGYNSPSGGWIIQNNEVRLNAALGIVAGSNSQVLSNSIHDNGEMGIGCQGTDVLVANNEIAGNGFFAGLDPLWEGGGAKCAVTNRLIVRGNYSHDNAAMGFWTDIDNINTTYENNRIENNLTGGISHEISYAAVIRNNTFKGNGYGFFEWLWGAAIQIQNSQNVEVYGNTVEANTGNGIVMIQQNRGSGAYGVHATVNNYIHDNTIVSTNRDSSVGAVADYNSAGMKAGNNRMNANHYFYPQTDDDQFWWVDQTYVFTSFKQSTGQEAQGSLTITPSK